MTDKPRGLWRTCRPKPTEDDARIDDSGIMNWVTETLYRDRGYQPSFDQLPWKDAARKVA